ncbi:MAG: TolC family protein [Acidobacteria bacterium]|nr:TolC family protein [Acidobacteriota bacterium]
MKRNIIGYTALVLSLAIPCGAQQQASSKLSTPVLPLQSVSTPLAAPGNVLTLSLDEAYELALKNNLDLQVGRYDVARANAGILSKTGIFDPQLSAGLNGDWARSPAATQLAGAEVTESRNTRFTLGLNTLLPTGTALNVTTSASRGETNSQFFFLNPRWNTNLNVTIKQPLLNGFGTLVNRAGIVIARNNRAQSSAAFKLKVMDTLSQVENAYWDLVAARKAVAVKEESLKLAERLLDETRQRIKVGTSAPIDLVQPSATVAARRQALIAAKNVAGNAEDTLKALLGFDQPAEWNIHIKTADTLQTASIRPGLAASIEKALKHRPEVRQELLALASIRLNVKVARNQTLPRLDLQAGYGWNGLGGNLTLVDRTTGQVIEKVPGGLHDAYTQLLNREYPNWTMGITLGIPLGNHQAKANLIEQRFQLRQEEVRLESLKQTIIKQVRVAVRSLEDGAANIDAASAARQAAQKNLEAEETKFKNGLSTSFQVLQIQDDLAKAELTELQARAAYRKAIVGYRVATGLLLDDEHVAIVDPGQPKVPHDYWKHVKWLQFVDIKGTTPKRTAHTKENAS